MIDAQAIPPRHGEGDHPQDGGGGPLLLRQPIKQIKRARVLRKTLSLPEGLLRRELQKRPAGYRFRRQMPQAPYTIDFACLSARLAIELDGEAHNRGDQPAKDITRDAVLAERGFKTLRLSAYEVLKNMDACITAIVAACQESGPPPPSLRDGPPPRSGEEPQ
ncbi:endonuclease domain-containing protein [uncultured Novosphingobium sp.]|uniref:endonuclease domain-containing protein n=1 Tax=uncultured Novosphingobium sp. TaxID=292277 RepID=UPI00258B3618|nr:endonuclease domain-containing protein [uncultured Novosphingobium sp.]